jgi:hypothetical protein
MIFNKYEFTDEDTWKEVKETLYTSTAGGGVLKRVERSVISEVNSIVEIGHICFAYDEEGECTDLSPMYAVDMLLNEQVDSLDDYIVYPDPLGVHSFAGDESLYLKGFCLANPESPYCITPKV